jgi:putative transposase
MYKNIEVLDKEKFKDIKFSEVEAKEVGKNIGLIPLGFTEVWNASHDCAVIISAGENAEFLAFCGVTNEVTIFNKEDVYLPAFIRTYPFINMDVRNEKNELSSVIGIDKNPQFVAKNKKIPIIDKDKNISKEANDKIELVRELNRQRDVSRNIISELKEHDLLVKKDLNVKVQEEEKVILDEFYIIDIQKLIKLDDKILATWARKGWMGIFDAHVKSIANFKKVLESNK